MLPQLFVYLFDKDDLLLNIPALTLGLNLQLQLIYLKHEESCEIHINVYFRVPMRVKTFYLLLFFKEITKVESYSARN